MRDRKLLSFCRKIVRPFLLALLCTAAIVILPYLICVKRYAPADVPFPVKTLVASLGGFFGLFVWADAFQLYQRQNALFRTILKNLHFKGIFAEIVYQVAFTGAFYLFFFLLGQEQISPFRLFFYGVASIIGASTAIHLKSISKVRKAVPFFYYLFVVSYSLNILALHGYTNWSASAAGTMVPLSVQVLPWIRILGLALVLIEFRTSACRALFICAGGGLLYFVYPFSGLTIPAEVFGIVLLGNLAGSPRLTAKVFFALFLFYAAFLLIGNQVGWVENIDLYFSYAGWTKGYGMGHSNLFALLLFSILVLIWYLWLSDHPIILTLVSFAGAILIWYVTYCRTVVILLCALPFLNLLLTFSKNKKWRWPFKWSKWLPLVFSAISIIGMYWIPTQTLISINGNFFARFTLPYLVFKQYGLTPFGAYIDRIHAVDNLFLYLYVYYGYVSCVVITALLAWVGWEYDRKEQYTELSLFLVFMFYSLMENGFIHMPFAFSALLIDSSIRGCQSNGLFQQISMMREALSNPN